MLSTLDIARCNFQVALTTYLQCTRRLNGVFPENQLFHKKLFLLSQLQITNWRNLLLRFLKQINRFQDTVPILCHFLSLFSSNTGPLNHTGRGWWTWKVAQFSYLNQSTSNTSCCFINKGRINKT